MSAAAARILKFFSLCSTAKHARSVTKRISAERWVVANEPQTAAMLQQFQYGDQQDMLNLLRRESKDTWSPLWTRMNDKHDSQRRTLSIDLVDDRAGPFQTYNTIWVCTQEKPGAVWTCLAREWSLPDIEGSSVKEKELKQREQ
jgi:hypothetical protein